METKNLNKLTPVCREVFDKHSRFTFGVEIQGKLNDKIRKGVEIYSISDIVRQMVEHKLNKEGWTKSL